MFTVPPIACLKLHAQPLLLCMQLLLERSQVIGVMQEEFATGKSRRLSAGHEASPRPDLATAKTIVAGGRALKTKEDFATLDNLAAALGGAVGASRALVDAGIAPNELQVCHAC